MSTHITGNCPSSNSIRLQKRALTEKEAANYVGMSRSFLRQARSNGDRLNRTPAPRHIKIGSSVRYLIEDLDDWLDRFISDTPP